MTGLDCLDRSEGGLGLKRGEVRARRSFECYAAPCRPASASRASTGGHSVGVAPSGSRRAGLAFGSSVRDAGARMPESAGSAWKNQSTQVSWAGVPAPATRRLWRSCHEVCRPRGPGFVSEQCRSKRQDILFRPRSSVPSTWRPSSGRPHALHGPGRTETWRGSFLRCRSSLTEGSDGMHVSAGGAWESRTGIQAAFLAS